MTKKKKNLVIVESPAKAKTIKKFLGSNYKIEASMGHIRDLPKSQMGVDIENDFEPKYITIRGKGELLAKLRKEVKKANKIFLATDPDREGEAISWHLLHSLKLEDQNIYRITFNEITKNAIKSSIKNARNIDMDLVDAQQARRILDRIVGYKISPLLWKKVKKGLSAGRVQSVALKIICDREKEIDAFIPDEYWTIDAYLRDTTSKDKFVAKFYGTKNEKMTIKSKEEVDKIISEISKNEYNISQIKESQRTKKPPIPFTTSTLQQEAAKKLNFTTSKTMRIAQQLYEGVEVKGEGTVGLITYLRTDSTRISDEAHNNLLMFINENYGEEYVNKDAIKVKNKGKAQDAHEAIRPTYVHFVPSNIKESLSRDQYKLYNLIWSRFVASRMLPAKYSVKSIKIDIADYRFTSSLSILKFDGFLKVYKIEEDNADHEKISNITEDSKLVEDSLDAKQHFTQPPSRYTEASLVKTLEENGVGRPSTYAPTISTILNRGYISKENRSLFPTELGEIVYEILTEYFKDIVNVKFTANLEEQLDDVEDGNLQWKEVIRSFYPDFNETVEKAEIEVSKIEIKDEETDIECEKCGRKMVIKIGRYGKFLACPGFPECRNAKPILEKVEGVSCPLCDGDVLVKKTKKGRRYYGCEHNPECEFMTWNKPTNIKCDKCNSIMVEKGKKLMCINDECKNVVSKE
jgi:DNA topoisomerase-1